MKKTFILSTIALLSIVPASFAQDFDFQTLDKLGGEREVVHQRDAGRRHAETRVRIYRQR